MPAIIPVIGAVAAIGTAAGAVATAGITLTSVLAVTAAVGATLGAVGSVTKNKGLMTAGMVLGAVGAIGGLASAAGVFGDTSTIFSGASGASGAAGTPSSFSTSGIASDASSAATYGPTSSFLDVPPSGQGMTDLAAGVDVASNDWAPQSAISDLSGPPPPTDSVSASATTDSFDPETGTPVVTPKLDPNAVVPAAPPEQVASVPEPPKPVGQPPPTQTAAVTGKPAEVPGQPTPTNVPDTKPQGWFARNVGGIMDFANKHPVVAYGALQAGGSLLSGMNNSLTPAQVAELNSRAAQQNAAAKVTNIQATNMAQPKSVATSTPVTGQPMMPTGGTQQGFMQMGSPPPLAPVTGVPA